MTPPLHTWEECRICWEAKGHKFENIADAVEQLFKDRIGFKRTSLSGLSRSTKPAPPEAIEFVWGLPLAPGASERKYAIYLRGLELQQQVDVIAAGVGPKMDALQSAIGGRLDALLSAMGDKVEAAASTVRATLDGFASTAGSAFEHVNGKLDRSDAKIEAVASVLTEAGSELEAVGAKVDGIPTRVGETHAKIDAVTVKVGGVEARLNDAGAKVDAVRVQVDGVGAKLDEAGSTLRALRATLNEAEARRARDKRDLIRVMFGTGLLVGLGLVALALVQSGYLAATQDARGFLSFARHSDAALGRPKVRPVPHQALPHQAVAPCRSTAITLHGSCWIQVANYTAPCPLDFYQEGNFCYLPLMAEPKEPSSVTPLPPNPESR